MTDYTDPSTVNVDVVRGEIDHAFRVRGDAWTDRPSWPNVTVKAMADRIRRLELETHPPHVLAFDELIEAMEAMKAAVESTPRELGEGELVMAVLVALDAAGYRIEAVAPSDQSPPCGSSHA